MFAPGAALGRGAFAGLAAVAGGAPALFAGELLAADGADGWGFVGCATALGLGTLALLAAVAGGVVGDEGPAAVEAVQAVLMAG